VVSSTFSLAATVTLIVVSSTFSLAATVTLIVVSSTFSLAATVSIDHFICFHRFNSFMKAFLHHSCIDIYY